MILELLCVYLGLNYIILKYLCYFNCLQKWITYLFLSHSLFLHLNFNFLLKFFRQGIEILQIKSRISR
jgi:hypothetical protein